MYLQVIKSGLQKISAVFVSFIMIASLSFPLTVRAEGTSETGNTAPSQQLAQPITISASEGQPVPQDTSNPAPEASSEGQPAQPQVLPSQQTSLNAPSSPVTAQSPQPQTSTNVDSTAPTTQSNAQTNTSLSNAINSDATSGNASANQNTTVGDITTGNAAALATIVNLLQSNVNLNGAQPITFVQDITGTVSGDLIVDPAVIAALGTNSSLFDNTNAGSTVDASTQANITNAINIHATSGNASANQNTTAGNVQSGSANAVANVVNLINSSISSGQSFIGMVNIYGNLHGNILVPEAFVNSILGTGTTPTATNGTIVTTDNNATVTNNVNTAAQSGNASATDNTTTGTVSTGQAQTNVTILNLTSNQTVGKNALLVFVNVLGNWVGLIMDAPAGTTSASLGGDASIAQNTNRPDAIDSTNNYQINNTINTTANSGSATAHENTRVGNIGSGNASSSVNLLNILNSQINLSDWFGILFINVFGTWNGNFGVQTAVVTPTNPGAGGNGVTGGNSPGSGTTTSASPPLFRFVPSSQRNYTSRSFNAFATTSPNTSEANLDTQYANTSQSIGNPTVLGATDTAQDKINLQTSKDKLANQGLHWWLLPLVALIALLLAIRYYAVRRRGQQAEL